MTDDELKKLKEKRLEEMQKNITHLSKNQENEKNIDSREVLVARLGHRGLEVLQNAESQFPAQTRTITKKLSELIISGEIDVKIEGGDLLALFRSVGMDVRMATKINVQKDGKTISLSESMKSKK
ncbi:MAG: DNA-binding protein [Candidatus Nitrosoabyssus spongiisocia]|nr:MAG: DNA-binding protein [Nitrosopumilaceae archaeon AB1(1)]